MKKLLFAILLFSFSARAQDTVVNNLTAVAVQPIRYSVSDTADVVFAGAMLDYDDLRSYANVRVSLMDSAGNVLYQTYVKIEGEDYTGWQGTNAELFTIVCAKLLLTIKDEE